MRQITEVPPVRAVDDWRWAECAHCRFSACTVAGFGLFAVHLCDRDELVYVTWGRTVSTFIGV